MTGVASSLWLQPTGGEAGGEIRNCLTGCGGAKYDLSMSSSPFWICGEERDENGGRYATWRLPERFSLLPSLLIVIITKSTVAICVRMKTRNPLTSTCCDVQRESWWVIFGLKQASVSWLVGLQLVGIWPFGFGVWGFCSERRTLAKATPQIYKLCSSSQLTWAK